MLVKRHKKTALADHRMYLRVELMADVTFEGDHNFYWGMAENISEGGLFVCTYQLAEIGTELDLIFTLPVHDGPLKVRARVQWVREYSILNSELSPGVGLQFLDPGPDVVVAVRKFVAEREPTYYE